MVQCSVSLSNSDKLSKEAKYQNEKIAHCLLI